MMSAEEQEAEVKTQVDRLSLSKEQSHKQSHEPIINAPYDNPRDWPRWKKWTVSAIVNVMALTLTYASSAYSASTNTLIDRFHVSRTVIILGVALFVLGFSFGPLLFGPFAQVFGHRPVYIATFICFTAMSFGVSESPNIGSLLTFRFLGGVFGSSSLNNTPASVADITTPQHVIRYLLIYGLCAFGGPGLGPLLGAFIDNRAGWRWNMRMQAIFVAIMTIVCILFLPETNHQVLQANANRAAEVKAEHEKQNGNTVHHATLTWQKQWKQLNAALKVALSGPFVWLFAEPVVTFISLYLSLLYAVLYLTFVVIPLAFEGKRHFSQESNGLIFISLIVGFLLSAAVFFILQTRYIARLTKTLRPGDQPMPEARLHQALWASFLPPLGLFIFAWTAPFPHVHWIGPCIGLAFFTAGTYIIFVSLIPYLVVFAGPQAPLVLAAATSTRSLMAAAFPVFGVQMFDGMTIQGGCSMLAGVALLMTPLPFILTRYGASLRAKSRRRVANA